MDINCLEKRKFLDFFGKKSSIIYLEKNRENSKVNGNNSINNKLIWENLSGIELKSMEIKFHCR